MATADGLDAAEEAIRRAVDAKAVLENPAFLQAMTRLREDMVDAWKAAPARDAEGREQLWRLYQTAERFEGLLQAILNEGAYEKARLLDIERDKAMRAANGIPG